MNFKTHNNTEISINATSYQGEVDVSYKKLLDIFGIPLDGDGYKVDAEWKILFEDGTIASIYNYKDGKNYNGKDGLATKKIRDWHIGGFDKRAVELVELVLFG
jgi:hypothetical protein